MQEALVSSWFKVVERLIELKSPYLPSPPDARDFSLYQIGVDVDAPLPTKIVLPRPPFILDQLDNPFCVGAAMAGLYNSYHSHVKTLPDDGFSMAYGYWRCKELDGIPDTPGTYLRTMCKVAQQEGIATEKLLPLKPGMKKPVLTNEMKGVADKYKIKGYARVDVLGSPETTLRNIKQALNSGKYVLVGTLVTSENWLSEEAKSKGYLRLPTGFILGAHATFLSGADDDHIYGGFKSYKNGFNSWGEVWGKQGEYFMPNDYVRWTTVDMPGFVAFQEAWAIEFEKSPDLIEKRIQMKLKIDSNTAIVNGETIKIDDNPIVKPIIIQGWNRTMVPLRFIAENFGAKVIWYEKTREIDIELDEAMLSKFLRG